MAAYKHQKWIVSILLSMLFGYPVNAQRGPPALIPGSGRQICNYQFAIPIAGNCVTYGPAFEEKLTTVQQDFSETKLQFKTQVSDVKNQMQRVMELDANTAIQVADMTLEFQALQALVLSLKKSVASITTSRPLTTTTTRSTSTISPTSAGTSARYDNALLNQLTQQFQSLQDEMKQMKKAMQSDKEQQNRTVAALRLELEQAKQESSSLRTDLTQLQKTVDSQQKELIRLQQMTSLPVVQPTTQRQTSSPTTLPTTTTRTTFTTTPPLNTLLNVGPTVGNGGVTNVLVQQLQSEVANLTSRVSQLEQQKGPVDLRELTQNLTFIRTKIENQSKELSSDTVAVDEMMNYRLPAAENDAKVIHDSLQNLNQTMQGVLQSLRLHNLTKIEQDIGRLGSNALDMKLNMTQDEKFVQNFNTEFSLLKLKVNKLANEIPHSTTQAPTTPRPTYAHMPTLPTKRVTT